MSGTDTSAFHEQAIILARELESAGLGVWIPSYNGNAPISILSLVYYYFEPKIQWVLPLNIAIHGLSAVLLFQIFHLISNNRHLSIISSLPFILFPSSALWYSQFHKDGLAILGYYLIIFSLLASQKGASRILGKYAVLVSIGILLAWYMRPYMVDLLFLFFVSLFLIGFVTVLINRKLPEIRAVSVLIIAIASTFWLSGKNPNEVWSNLAGDNPNEVWSNLAGGHISSRVQPEYRNHGSQVDSSKKIFKNPDDLNSRSQIQSSFMTGSRDYLAFVKQIEDISHKISNTVFEMRRANFMLEHATTTLDPKVTFRDPESFIEYFPLALANSFFSPYLSQLLKAGNDSLRSGLKRLVIVEVLVAYVSFIGFAVYLIENLKNRKLILVLFFVTFFLTILGYVIGNAGSLMRMRYPWHLIWVGLGFGWLVRGAFRIWKRQEV